MVEKEKYKEWINCLRIIESESTYFLRFAVLWLSFACWLNQEYSDKKWEKAKLDEFKKNDRSRSVYYGLFTANDSFRKKIEDFANTKLPKRETVINTGKINSDKEESVSFKKEEMADFDKFVDVIYQIRCNFFHGHKLPSGEDEDLIIWAYESFLPFWKKFIE